MGQIKAVCAPYICVYIDTNRVECGKICVKVWESEKKFSRPEKIVRKFKTKKYEGRMKISVLR